MCVFPIVRVNMGLAKLVPLGIFGLFLYHVDAVVEQTLIDNQRANSQIVPLNVQLWKRVVCGGVGVQ